MTNQQGRDGNAGAEKHSGEDKADNAERYPEPGARRCGLRIKNRSGDCRSVLKHDLWYEWRAGNIGDFGRHHKTISFARNRFYVERFFRGITQYLAKFVHCCVDVGVVIYVRVGGPETLSQFLASYDLMRLFEESHKDLIHLSL